MKKKRTAQSRQSRVRTGSLVLVLTLLLLVCSLVSGIAAKPSTWELLTAGVGGHSTFVRDESSATTQEISPDGVWRDVDEAWLADPQSPQRNAPRSYRTLSLGQSVLRSLLDNAPMEAAAASLHQRTILTLPTPDGMFLRFAVSESPILAPELAARFPEIKTYAGQGIDDPTATTRFDWTPSGFHGIILSSRDTILIEPYDQSNQTTHIVYFQREMPTDSGTCGVTEAEQEAAIGQNQRLRAAGQENQVVSAGPVLSTYRLAVAATAEYTQTYGGGTVAGALSAITTTINLVNAIYERDVAIRMTLIANETDIIFTDPLTDGYTSNNIPALINENQAKLDSVIGSANYDIGHVFDGQQLGGGFFSWQGQAAIRAVCVSGIKARGVDVFRSLQPTSVYTYYSAAHEFGHQFGATHTFNTTSGSCGSQRAAATAYEPANGSTIMAYRLACSPEDLASTDTFFHAASVEQILTYIGTGNGQSCAVTSPTGNQAPTVAAGPQYTIPRSTPFTLTATGSDPDGDPITFSWEEFDLGTASPPSTDDGSRPIFRAFAPTSSPSRTFPRLQNILSGTTQTLGESLPTTTRTMTFRVTGRDNRAEGGGVSFSSTSINVRSDAGPFTITEPVSSSGWTTGSTQMVTWTVANTNNAPVSCANVRITLSTDGGLTFPIILAAISPNDGSEIVTIPGTTTANARVKVEGVGNVFFNISQSFGVSGLSNSTPTITGFSPASGVPGTNVTINGTNFINPSAVLFNGVSASFTVNSTTAIVATVPSGATSGPITVTTPAGTASSSSQFTVVTPLTINISGRVTDYKGIGVPDVTMTFTLARSGTTETRITQTDASGNYSSGEVPCSINAKVTPSKGSASFSPISTAFVSTSGCVSGPQTVNFSLVPPVVISQFYTAGGEPGATYRNDFIELFNRGDTTVDFAGWSLQFTSATGMDWTRLNLSLTLLPGQHFLIQLASGGAAGSDVPAPDAIVGIAMSSTGGKVALLSSVDQLPAGFFCPGSNALVNFVGYGATANCFSGALRAPAPGVTTAARRGGGGCVNTGNNGADFALEPPAPRNFAAALTPCNPQWQPVALTEQQIAEIKAWTVGGRTYVYVKPQFPDAGYRVVNWGQALRDLNDFTADASVEKFSGPSILAMVTTAQIYDLGPLTDGTYNFDFKTSGTLVKTLQFTVSSAVPPPNPIDNAREFVKQQYRDFLNREADQAGEDFWTDNITKCMDPARRPPGQTVEQCTLRQRETTSGAFFLSPEFQYTGYFVYRMYQGALGRQPKLSEFTPDALFVGNGIIVNGQLSGAKINQNKADYATQFVNCVDATKYRCAEFKAIYDGLTNQEYVDKLFQTTGVNVSASDRAALVNGLNAMPATETRASVLQKVVDGINVISEGNQQFTTTYGQAFYNSEFNRAFVQLEYFGYMKRDPDEAGYAFWLGKLSQFGGDFVAAEMVLAFISSPEYRARFGQP